MSDSFVIYLSLWARCFRIGVLAALAVVIPFPLHRVRRTRRMIDVFAPLRDAVEFERAQARFVWACTVATTLLSAALHISIG